MKLKDLYNMPARNWKTMGESELRRSYQQMKHAMKERAKTFAKYGEEGKTLPSSRGLSLDQMRTKLKEAAKHLRSDVSTYKGWKAEAEQKLSDMQEALPELNLKSVQDLRDFGEFMNDMKEKYKSIHYDSDEAKKIYQQAMRLNIDPDEAAKAFFEEGTRLGVSPSKFMRNYKYWEENIKYLKDVEPIKQRAGSRALKPSDYARKLERIRSKRKGSE